MEWKKLTRSSGLVEYVCEHGVGHPDYQSAKVIAKRFKGTIKTWLVHGCCGCCDRPDFPGSKKNSVATTSAFPGSEYIFV